MATTYNEFLAKWNNKYVDFDGYYGAQCMDLVQQYASELGLGRFWGNAADVANQTPPGWTQVSSPERGDVTVFERNAANGYYGHIAINDRPGYYFSQNYPTFSNSHIERIPDRIIAVLRPANKGASVDQAKYDELFRFADLLNGFAVDGLFERIIGRKATPKEMADYKTFGPGNTVKRLRESGEHRQAVNKVYKTLLGRDATDEDYRIRYEQDLPEMWVDVANSQAHKDYINSLKKG